MLKKIKKCLLIIPTIFMMLFNIVSISAFAEDVIEINYTDYFIDLSEIPELQGYEFLWDSTKDPLNPGFEKYFYSVDTVNNSSYDDYISGEKDYFVFAVYYYDLTNVQTISNDYQVIPTTTVNMQRVEYEYYRDGTLDHYTPFIDYTYMEYNPKSGYVDYDNYEPFVFDDQTHFDVDKYYIHLESNHPDFPVPNYFAPSDSLNVKVVFTPELSGEVDRSMIGSDGLEYLSNSFTMTVYNNNDYAIQYSMEIVSGIFAENYDPFFRYYSNDWVYARSLDSHDDYYYGNAQKQNKATNCHYVLPGRTDTVTFNYSSIRLDENVPYMVVVYAGRNDFGYASEFVETTEENVDPFNYEVFYSTVYSSSFTMKQYSDVKYDPNTTYGGVLPYDYDTANRYDNSYNAVEKEDGSVDYVSKDIYSDQNSWYNKPIDSGTGGSSSSGSSSSSKGFTNFAKSFSNFFGFLTYMFNFLPSQVKTIFTLGFTALVVICIIKVVFK